MTRTLPMLLALLALAPTVRGENLALVPGRLATPAVLPERSLELGYLLLEDGNYLGGRFNYRFDARTMLYADFGQVEFDPELEGLDIDADGQAFGAGVFYHLPDAVESYDVSLRASYHRGKVGVDDSFAVSIRGEDGIVRTGTGTIEGESQTEYSADIVLSGREPLAENGLRWYASVGYHVFDFEQEVAIAGAPQRFDASGDDSGIGFGVGLVLPLESGQAYAGYESIDGDTQYGAGFRYFFGG